MSDLRRSLAFYRDGLGFSVERYEPEHDLAIVDARGFRVLLAGPAAGDRASLLSGAFSGPGATIYVSGGSRARLEGLRHCLTTRGLRGVCLIERPWGDSLLRLPDPDGYVVEFWTPIELPPDELLALYTAGPATLDGALAGLGEPGMNLAARPGAWSIRHIVHHLADSEVALLGRTKAALAEPGRLYTGTAFDQDTWSDALDYAGRPVEPSLALFRAIRAHMTQLFTHLPHAWNSTTRAPDGSEPRAEMALRLATSHALEHIEDIRAIRERHGS